MKMIKDIENKILEGINSTYVDIIRFNREHNAIIKPEYIITVNIAQKISEINEKYNPDEFPLRIKLEERARKVLNLCKVYDDAKSINDLFILNKCRELDSKIKPKERVDIVIYDYNDKPITVIEVKKFTEYPNLLIKDINRNLNFLGWFNQKLYDTILKNTYLVFLINDKDAVTENDINTHVAKIKKDYEKFIAEMNINNHINSDVKVYSITDSLINNSEVNLPQDIKQLKFEERHHYLCVIIKFERQ